LNKYKKYNFNINKRKGKFVMKAAVIKLLDADRNIIGYRTDGLKRELYINMFIEEDTAIHIMSKIEEMKTIPDEITGIVNVTIKVKQYNDRIELLLPDESGKYPDA